MLSVKPVGRQASARKYDILTALGAYALARGKHEHRLVLRLMTLITARYNWARDELAVGQREIARMWHVDERTVKREMAKLRGLGWLIVKRQGARGRVTQYGIDIDCMLRATKDQWSDVGPDFDLRMQGEHESNKVVSLPVKGNVAPPDVTDGSEWTLTQAIVYAEDPAMFASWVRGLDRVDRAGGRLTLRAPSRFHAAYVQTHLVQRLVDACRSVDSSVSEIILVT